jgi:hypothetical protein
LVKIAANELWQLSDQNMNKLPILVLIFLSTFAITPASDLIKTANGVVEGRGGQTSGVRVFRGIPFCSAADG